MTNESIGTGRSVLRGEIMNSESLSKMQFLYEQLQSFKKEKEGVE